MPKMFDYDNNEWINVPDSEVGDRLYTGQFVLPKNSRIRMKDPEGNNVTIPSSEAYELMRQGFTYRTHEQDEQERDVIVKELEKRAAEEELGVAGPWIAAGIKGAREYSFGLTDIGMGAAERLGYAKPGEAQRFYRRLEEAYPKASFVGGLGGAIGSPIGRGVAAGAERLGLGVAGVAGKAGLNRAGILGKGVKYLTQKGVEGAADQVVYEGSKILGDIALSDDVTMEMAMQRLKSAGLWGSVFGPSIPVTGHAARNAIKGLKKASEKVAATKGGQAAKDIAAKVAAKAFGAGKGWGKEAEAVIEEALKSPKMRDRLMAHVRNPEQIAREATESIENAFSIASKVSKDFRGVKRSLREEGPIATQKITPQQRKGWEKVKKSITDTFPKMEEESIIFGQKPRKLAEQMLAATEKRLATATTAGEFFDAIDGAKGFIDRVGKKDAAAGFWDGTISESAKMVGKYRNDVNKFLKDEKLFDNYARSYSNVNNTLNHYMGAYEKVFGMGKKPGLFTKSVKTLSGNSKLVVDGKKISAYLKSPNKTHPEKWEALDEYFAATQRLIHNAKKPVTDLPAKTSLKLVELAKSAERDVQKVKKYIDETLYSRQASLIVDSLQAKTGAVLNQPQAMGVAGGYALGPLGAAVGYGVGTVLSKPFTTIKVLKNIDDAAEITLKKLEKAASAFSGKPIVDAKGKIKHRTNYYAPTRRVIVDFARELDLEHADTIEEKVRGIIDKVHEYSDDPTKLEDDFSQYVVPKDDDGKLDGVSAAIDNSMLRSMRFLAQKAPQLSNDEYLGGERVRIPHSQLARFQKYAEAVADPSILLGQIESMSIDPTTVETVKEIYPSYFEHVRTTVLMAAAQNKKLSYQQKVQLGILFEAPTTTALQNVQAIQKNIIEVGKKQAQQQVSRRTSQAAIDVGNESTMGQNLAGRG